MTYQILELNAFSVTGMRVPSAEVSALWKRCRADGLLARLAGDVPWPLELFWGGAFEEGGVSMLGVVCGKEGAGMEVYRCPRSRWFHTAAEGPHTVLEEV